MKRRFLFALFAMILMVFPAILSGIIRVRADEMNTIDINLYPPEDEFENNYDYAEIRVSTGSSGTYTWFRPIYVNDTNYDVISIAYSVKFRGPYENDDDGRLYFFYRNEGTATNYQIGGYHDGDKSTWTNLNIKELVMDFTSTYVSSGEPIHFSLGYQIVRTAGFGTDDFDTRWYYVVCSITYSRGGGCNVDSIVEAIDGLNTTMQTRFNSVDIAISDLSDVVDNIQGNVAFINSTVLNINSTVGYINTTVNNIKDNITYLNTTISNLSVSTNSILYNLANVSGNISYLNNSFVDYLVEFDEVKSNISNIFENVSSIYTNLSYWMPGLFQNISFVNGSISSMNSTVNSILGTIDGKLDDIFDDIDDLETLIEDSIDDIMDRFDSVDDDLDDLFTYVSSEFSDIQSLMNTYMSYVNDSFDSIAFLIENSTIDILDNLNISTDNILLGIENLFNATMDLTNWTLTGFNGTTEQFNYTFSLINSTFDLLNVSNFGLSGIWEQLNVTNVTMLELYNSIYDNITDCCDSLISGQNQINVILYNHELLLHNIEISIRDLQHALIDARVITIDGNEYLLRYSPVDVIDDYLFISDGWFGTVEYYTYSIQSSKYERFDYCDVDVNYTGYDIDGRWPDIIVVAENGEIFHVLDKSNYDYHRGTFVIDTVGEDYLKFTIHVNPTFWGRVKIWWNDFWSF